MSTELYALNDFNGPPLRSRDDDYFCPKTVNCKVDREATEFIPKPPLTIQTKFTSHSLETLFEFVQFFDSSGSYPEVALDAALEVIGPAMLFGIDSLIDFLCPTIAQNFTKFSLSAISQLPCEFKKKVIDLIPISKLDIDYTVKAFHPSSLHHRFSVPPLPIYPIDPFLHQLPDIPQTEESIIANALMRIKPSSFSSSPFVREHCTILSTDIFISISEFSSISQLTLTSCDLPQSISSILNPSITRLVISKTKLRPSQISEICSFISSSSLSFLCLRDTRMGPVGCDVLASFFKSNGSCRLKFLDISLNAIGGSAISNILSILSSSELEGLAVDGNFFRPDSESLTCLPSLRMQSFSLRGIHWDLPTSEIAKASIKSPNIKWWDLSAQVVHMNSDPDLSGSMAEYVLSEASQNIETLYFSNHRLDSFSFAPILKMRLKELTLSNSNLTSVDEICPALGYLEKLDISYNAMIIKTSQFFTSCAQSKSLRYLFLSSNDFGDVVCANFLTQLKQNCSPIQSLRLRACNMAKKSSAALISLLRSGAMKFDELDVGGNSLFHNVSDAEESGRTCVKYLMIGGNEPKADPILELFTSVECVEFLDVDYFSPSIIAKSISEVFGLETLTMCYSRCTSDKVLSDIVNGACVRSLWLVNSVSAATLTKLLWRWAELPSLIEIHIGTDLEPPKDPQIPLIVEGRV